MILNLHINVEQIINIFKANRNHSFDIPDSGDVICPLTFLKTIRAYSLMLLLDQKVVIFMLV